jgi:DNA-binding MurR/RpiR family transcriptional regulator
LHRRIADHCLADPLSAGTRGIEELASAAGVSVATVARFARRLGLDGFASFRAWAIVDIQRLMTPEEKLEARAAQPCDDREIIAASFEATTWNLERTRAANDAAAWCAAAAAIRRAERVVFVGFGLSAVLVGLLADMLEPFCRAQLVVDGRGGPERTVRRCLSLGAADLVVAVTLPRYSRATLEHVAEIRAQGARVLGVTDVAGSPLDPLCDVVLHAPAEHPLLHASATAVVAVFEVLTTLLTAHGRSPCEAAEFTLRIGPYIHQDPGPGAPAARIAPRNQP